MRKTKIVCTIGPASSSEEVLTDIIGRKPLEEELVGLVEICKIEVTLSLKYEIMLKQKLYALDIFTGTFKWIKKISERNN